MAEYEAGCPATGARHNPKTAALIDRGEPAWPSTIDIHRVYLEISTGYEQDLDLTRLHAELSDWSDELIEAVEAANSELDFN